MITVDTWIVCALLPTEWFLCMYMGIKFFSKISKLILWACTYIVQIISIPRKWKWVGWKENVLNPEKYTPRLFWDTVIALRKMWNFAVHCFQLASQNWFSLAQNYLAFCYQHGLGVPQGLTKAIVLYQLAADTGNSYAQHNLSYCYQHGIAFVAKSHCIRLLHWKSVAVIAQDISLHKITLDLEYGIGVPQFTKAVQISSIL